MRIYVCILNQTMAFRTKLTYSYKNNNNYFSYMSDYAILSLV